MNATALAPWLTWRPGNVSAALEGALSEALRHPRQHVSAVSDLYPGGSTHVTLQSSVTRQGHDKKVYLSIHGRHSFLLVLEAADDLQQTLHSEQEGTRDMKHCSKRVQPPRGTRVLWQASDEVGGIKWEENNTKKYTITWRRCS